MNARRRRRAWIVAAAPAAAGATSLAVGSGDFRSSGLIAGVGLSALLATVLLAVRVPWRGNSWLRRGAGVARVGVVGVVALAALAVGVPEFLQERFGLLLSPEDMGLRSVTLVDDRFVAVGAARSGAAWVSVDATSWEPVAVPETIAGADIVDLAHVSDGVFAIAQDDADAALLAVTADVTQQWREADRFAHDVFGVAAKAADGRGQQLVVAGDIYGNDVVVFHGEPPAALTADAPEPEFDRGYEVNDVACNVDGCVAVGARIRVDAAIWHSPDGADWERIDMELTNAEFVAVASTRDGFVAVGTTPRARPALRGVQQTAARGTASPTKRPSRPPSSTGVAILDGVTTVFGRNPNTRRDHDVESHQRPELGAKGRSHRRHQDRASGTSQPTVRSASASASTQTTHLARCGPPETVDHGRRRSWRRPDVANARIDPWARHPTRGQRHQRGGGPPPDRVGIPGTSMDPQADGGSARASRGQRCGAHGRGGACQLRLSARVAVAR